MHRGPTIRAGHHAPLSSETNVVRWLRTIIGLLLGGFALTDLRITPELVRQQHGELPTQVPTLTGSAADAGGDQALTGRIRR